MKKVYNYIFVLSAFFSFVSCDNFMDVHEEYIKGGEIIYAPKTDSVLFVAGKGRVMFYFWLYNSPNVKTVNLYWNAGQDSLITPVSPSTGLDSMNVLIPNLPEGSYTFNVKTTDSFGHNSLFVTGFGNSYGDFFQSSISNRRIRDVGLTDEGGQISWFTSLEGMVRTEVRYLTNDGDQKIISASSDETIITCPNAKAGSSFEYRSLFIPEEQSIDTFSVEWTQYDVPFPSIYQYNRNNWSVLEVSDETASDGGGKNTLIDGKLDTWWHSNYSGGNAPLPHWAIIDMVSSKKICRVDIYRRPGNRDAKTAQLFVGPDSDPDSNKWIKIGEGIFPSDADNVKIEIPDSQSTLKGRYLKLLLPDSNREPFISIAEIYLYGN